VATKWTTNPLNYDSGMTYWVKDENGSRVCGVMTTDYPKSKAGEREKIRNVKLITSAPALLSALKDILDKGMNQKTVEAAVSAIRIAEPTGSVQTPA
jgi:hypothetical protein